MSENPLAYAKQRATEQGRGDQIDFHLRDYRHQTSQFERIGSVGMLEHVGAAHFNSYFAIARTDRGLLQSSWVENHRF